MTLEQWKNDRKITFKEMSEATGVGVSFLSLICSARRKIPIKRLREFEKMTGMTRQELRPELYE
jgi:DNA-binding transcriptional regulator YdaS (Cro superfamily)